MVKVLGCLSLLIIFEEYECKSGRAAILHVQYDVFSANVCEVFAAFFVEELDQIKGACLERKSSQLNGTVDVVLVQVSSKRLVLDLRGTIDD